MPNGISKIYLLLRILQNLTDYPSPCALEVFHVMRYTNLRLLTYLLTPGKNLQDLHQSQDQHLPKVGWACPPQSTPWRRQCLHKNLKK